MMIFGFLMNIALIALVVTGVVLVVRKATARAGGGPADAHAVRRFFQYLVMFALMVIAAIGVLGLLSRPLERGAFVGSDADLARSLACTIVGVPLYAGMAWWTRRAFVADPGEARSLGWACYTTAACLTALGFMMGSAYGVLAWATRLDLYSAGALAGLLVWAALWGTHWWLDSRVTPAGHTQVHHLLGSLAALAVSATGLGVLVAGTIEVVTGIGRTTGLVENDKPLLRGAALLVVGVPVWLLYWWRTASRSPHNPIWLAYVLLAGVAGGLVTAVVGASVAVYDVLVWLLGQPWSEQASVHFRGLPAAVGAGVTGLLVWWYHHTVLRATGERERTEVVRVYEYLMAGTGLVAAAVGFTMVVVALVEALTTSGAILGTAAVNTLLAALTVMAVGGPVWAVFWHRIQLAARAAPAAEHTSPTRRIYLLLLFGVAGIAAVVALLVGVYVLAEDALAGTVGAATLRSLRVPIGILVSTGVISGYHAMVYRADRAAISAAGVAETHGPRYVLLVGPPDPLVVAAVAHETGGQVQAWRTDETGITWTAAGVLAAIAALGPAPVEEVVVVSEPDGVHAFGVHRH